MRCPACEKTVEPDAWLCPFCEHIIDPSVLAPSGEDDDLDASEPTKMVAMPPPPAETEDDPLPDAMILGDVGIAEDEFAVVEGAGVQSNGKTSTFLYYATGASTRVVHPDAVPRLTQGASRAPRTPYEDFILSCVDGARSVRDIQRTSGLQPQEVVVTLLTLMDKGAVEIRTLDGGPGASRPDGHVPTPAPDPDAPTDDQKAAPRELLARARRASRRQRTPPPVPTAPLDTAERVATQAIEVPDVSRSASPVPQGFDEDLPSVSDFHEITGDVPEDLDGTLQGDGPTPDLDFAEPGLPAAVRVVDVPEETTQLGEPPPPPRETSSFSDVWAENPSEPMDAAALIEDEQSLREAAVPSAAAEARSEEDWGPLTGPLDDEDLLDDDAALAPVMPSELDPPPDDSMGMRLPASLEDSMGPPPSADPPLAPVIPTDLEEDDEPDVTKEVFIPAKLRPVRPADRAPSVDPRRAPKKVPRAASAVVTPGAAPGAPVLDAALLRPAEPSVVAPAPRARSLADVVKRGPIEERDRRKPVRKPAAEASVTPAEVRPAPAKPEPRAKVEAPAEPPAKSEPLDPVDAVRVSKAKKLFDQALQDQAEGNMLSARMNMKLAITFDPNNEVFQTALAEIEAAPAQAGSSGPRPTGRSKAREFYDAATEAENRGDVDDAIALIEKAIGESRQPAFLNRLGVVLAMKKKEFVRAQKLIEEAIELSPGNPTYERNLHKILSYAATAGMDDGKAKEKKGLLGFLGRRK